MFDDLRQFIEEARQIGECKNIDGAHWDVEIGRIAELSLSVPESPVVVFDKIPGYPSGFRICANPFSSSRRTAMCLGLPQELTGLELIRAWRDKLANLTMIPPVFVKSGPIKENTKMARGRRWALHRHRLRGDRQGSRQRLGQSRHLPFANFRP
jgi:3-polyprenyl-4-hydroxybenzoate decarboxylase